MVDTANELSKLIVAKNHDELDNFMVAKGRDELDELAVAKGRDDSMNLLWPKAVMSSMISSRLTRLKSLMPMVP